MSRDISIIIVNYNVCDLVDNCIASVYKANENKYNLEIFLVDNNSIDGSVEYISGKYPGVIILSNEENIGFSKANNLALKKASGEYILILNPDTVLEESTFDKLIEFCRGDEKTGAVTSKLILADGKLDTACRRSFPVPSVAIPRMLGLSKMFPASKAFAKYNLTYLDENDTYEVDAICGAFMFIPKKVFDEVGLFDEDYFMYGEDLDLCYRIKKAGYKIYYFPKVTTMHFKGESTRKTHLSYVNNFYGAMSIFVKKNFKGSSRFLSYILQAGIFSRSALSYLKRIFSFFLFPFIDTILLYFSLIISVIIRFDIFPNKEYMFIITIYVFLWIFLLAIFGLYNKKNHLSFVKTFNAVIAGFFVNSSFTYFFKQYAYSREVVLTSTAFALVLLILWRLGFRIYTFFVSRNIMLNKINLLIVGNEKISHNIEDKLNSKYNIYHFNEIARRGTTSGLGEILIINKINEVIFTGNTFSNQDILNLMWEFRNSDVRFKIVPSGKELILSKINTSSLDELSLIEIEYNISNKLNIFLKRIFDIIFSFILLLTVYPAVIVLNKVFKMKLSKHTSKVLLLPKVFTGKLSFVGYPVWLKTDNKKHYLGKKGLTGLIQLNYYDGITEEEMNNYNIFYAKNQSLALDTEIILKTIFHILK